MSVYLQNPNRTQQLYSHAKQRIPAGTNLLSKRPELAAPQQWPAYFSKARGCEVWDLDDRHYFDFTTGGIGSCLLGFADPDVNAAVKACIDAGSMSTLNPPQEVALADLLCDIHPWASMARFTRTGGEAMAVAVRIARAHSNRDHVAVCGYHGWHDWYLAANLSENQALDGHLLPGLQPHGVPRALRGTVSTFRFNHPDELDAVIAQLGQKLGVIVVEPLRFDLPKDDFLQRIRQAADRVGAVLVFDEITSGWRHCFGGAHLKLNVEPDIAVFAKCTSNGFPFGAVIGRQSVMRAAETSFISSTFWTEAIGPTAALATIDKFRRVDLPTHIQRIGTQIREGWCKLSEKHRINVTIQGQPAMMHLALNYGDDAKALRTLLTQQMLEQGYLATDSLYPTFAQTPEIVDGYLDALDRTFAELKQALDGGDVLKRLRGPVATSGFQRLT
jgi:glutamate-1-semialdehyde aminotransferase